MRNKVQKWFVPVLVWIGMMIIPLVGFAQGKSLELNLKKGIGVMPELRSSRQKKLVRQISAIHNESGKGEIMKLWYDDQGRVIKTETRTVNGGYGDIHTYDRIANYTIEGNTLTFTTYDINTGIPLDKAVCELNEMGYIIREQRLMEDGDYYDNPSVVIYEYDEFGQTIYKKYSSGSWEDEFSFIWENGNIINAYGESGNYEYTNIENKVNIELSGLFTQVYDEDLFEFAFLGYIGKTNANLIEGPEYTFDEDGYVTKMVYRGGKVTALISYEDTSEPMPDPTPGEETPEDEFLDAIEQAPGGTKDNPTEVFIPSGGITLHQPLDINKHIRLKGGPLMRGEDNPYAMLRIREGYSLDLDGVTIDGGNTDLQDGSIIVYGNLRMREGTQLKNCIRTEADTPSGAICVAQSGYVRMDEGVTISGNTGAYGSAIYCEGFFEMYGGEISGNNGQIGAVVVNSGGTFRMYNGKISGNKVTEGCGGIYVGEGCRIEIYSGEISGNAHSDIYAWSNVYAGSPAKVDGLVYFTEGNRLQVMDALQHDWTITFLGEPQPGTVVAVGYTTYHLTESDLNHIHYVDDAYELALEGNTIVIAKDATGIEKISGVAPRLIISDKEVRMENFPANASYIIYNMYGIITNIANISPY